MSAVRGPHRLVLMQSGVYQYAEVEIDEPLHLVAANNVGKTTLIAALQFLYVDDSRQMHFAHEWSATKKHYFPETNSFVLFECMTELGWWVVGARGLGVTQAHNFERFLYQGRFKKEDYLEDGRFRRWEEVRDELAARQYRTLSPKDLRQVLTGSHKEVPLGLVPLRQASHFKSFRVLFRNLLRLAHLPASELQELLIEIHRHMLGNPVIDLQDSHEQYRKTINKAEGLRELKAVEGDIREAVELVERRTELRHGLVLSWRLVCRRYKQETAEARQNLERMNDALTEISAARDAAQLVVRELRDQQTNLNRDLGRAEQTLQDIDAQRAQFQNFDIQENRRKATTLTKQRDELIGRLHQLTNTDRGRIEKKYEAVIALLQGDRRLLRELSDTLVTRLRQSHLSDDEIDDAFRLFHPDLLKLSVGGVRESSIQVSDRDDALSIISGLAARIDDQGYGDGNVRIPLSALPASPNVASQFYPREIKARITENEDEKERLRQILRDLDQREKLEEMKGRVDGEVENINREYRAWEAWRVAEEERPELISRRDSLNERLHKNGEELTRLANLHEELRQKRDATAAVIDAEETRLTSLQKAFQHLTAPTFVEFIAEKEDGTEEELLAIPLESLIESYTRESREEAEINRRAERILGEVDRATASRYVGPDEPETVLNLKLALDSLEAQEEAVQQLWRSLITSLRRQLKGLTDDLRELTRQVRRLNRALAGRQISNLSKLELLLRPHDILVDRIQAILNHEEQPLFSDRRQVDQATRELARLLEDHPRLELKQLFDLQFQIEDASGSSKRFDSLDQIESQGTTVTIKVLVHLELLHRMLQEEGAHIPFFLDEVSVLDDQNLSAVIAHARSMNFVPVVASPDARQCVDTLYFLRSSGGEVILEPRTSRVRLRKTVNEEPHVH